MTLAWILLASIVGAASWFFRARAASARAADPATWPANLPAAAKVRLVKAYLRQTGWTLHEGFEWCGVLVRASRGASTLHLMPAFSFISELRSVVKDAMESSRKVNIIIGVLTDKDVPDDIRRDAEAGGLFILRLADLKDVEQAAQAAADRRTVWEAREPKQCDKEAEKETQDIAALAWSKSIKGFVEGISGNTIRGWAFDSGFPDTHPLIEASLDGEPIGKAVAGNPRPDLKRAGIADGNFGFVINLSQLLPEQRFSAIVVTARSAAGTQAILRHLPRAYPAVMNQALNGQPSTISKIRKDA